LNEVLSRKTGFVVPQKNSSAIAEAVLEVLEKPVVAYARASAARKLVQEKFDIRKNITPLLNLISA
jgi:glycosyltransferase involved in cell wall biosynthesis